MKSSLSWHRKRGLAMRRILFIIASFLLCAAAARPVTSRHLTPSEVKMVKQAVEDEIYDYGYYKDYYQMGENLGTPKHWIARIRIYIKPTYNSVDNYGEVIYKLMPYGEVCRLFYIEGSAGIKLDGDPQNGFPPTQPSRQTVFMDSDEISRFEQSWIKSFFVIDTAPSLETIGSAAQRQKTRTGFSNWEYEHPKQ